MSKTAKNTTHKAQSAARQEKLRAALRANLIRRKQASRPAQKGQKPHKAKQTKAGRHG